MRRGGAPAGAWGAEVAPCGLRLCSGRRPRVPGARRRRPGEVGCRCWCRGSAPRCMGSRRTHEFWRFARVRHARTARTHARDRDSCAWQPPCAPWAGVLSPPDRSTPHRDHPRARANPCARRQRRRRSWGHPRARANPGSRHDSGHSRQPPPRADRQGPHPTTTHPTYRRNLLVLARGLAAEEGVDREDGPASHLVVTA